MSPDAFDPEAFAHLSIASWAIELPRQMPFVMTESLVPTRGKGVFSWHGTEGFLSSLPLSQISEISRLCVPGLMAGKFTHMSIPAETEISLVCNGSDALLPFEFMDFRGKFDPSKGMSPLNAITIPFDYRGTEFLRAATKTVAEFAAVMSVSKEETHKRVFYLPTVKNTFVSQKGCYFWNDIASYTAERYASSLATRRMQTKPPQPKIAWRYCFMILRQFQPSLAVSFIPCAIHPEVTDKTAVNLLYDFTSRVSPQTFRNGLFSGFVDWDPGLMRRNIRRSVITFITPRGCTKGLPKT